MSADGLGADGDHFLPAERVMGSKEPAVRLYGVGPLGQVVWTK
jgi:hypothetical protein